MTERARFRHSSRVEILVGSETGRAFARFGFPKSRGAIVAKGRGSENVGWDTRGSLAKGAVPLSTRATWRSCGGRGAIGQRGDFGGATKRGKKESPVARWRSGRSAPYAIAWGVS
jgi:hypothetical protein